MHFYENHYKTITSTTKLQFYYNILCIDAAKVVLFIAVVQSQHHAL